MLVIILKIYLDLIFIINFMFDFLFVFVFSRVFSGGTPCFFCQTFAQPSPGRVAVIRRGCPVFLHCMAWNVYSVPRNK